MDHLIRHLGPGTYSRIARKSGLSHQHVGRVLRGDSGASREVIKKIAHAAELSESDVLSYIRSGGSPGMGFPAVVMHGKKIPLVACPVGNGTGRWDGIRKLVLDLDADGEEPTPRSAIRISIGVGASRAAQCLHSGKRSRANLLRGVDFTTSVDGGVLAVWRKG